MSRINSNDTLSKVSPFLIKKVIDSIGEGEVITCNKLRSGVILIKTKNLNQANKIIKICSLSPSIEVEVSEHNTLNFSKGVIYSNDLRGIPEEEILEEIKQQNIFKVEKIKRKSAEDNIEETGLIILTFNTISLPTDIAIGYEKVRVRTYVPLPLRCRNCLRYGHIGKSCKFMKLCSNCSQDFHISEISEEVCECAKSCINCKEQNQQHDHAATDKKCPIFLREKEIQAIVSLEKVSKRKATSLYKERHPILHQTYKFVINNNQSTPSQQTVNQQDVNENSNKVNINNSPSLTSDNPSQRVLKDYSSLISDIEISENEVNDVELHSVSSLSTPDLTADQETKKVFLLPKTTSNKNRQKLKKKHVTGTRYKK